MHEGIKFLMIWLLLLVWIGVLLGAFVYVEELEERWQRYTLFGSTLFITGASTFVLGRLLSRPGKPR